MQILEYIGVKKRYQILKGVKKVLQVNKNKINNAIKSEIENLILSEVQKKN